MENNSTLIRIPKLSLAKKLRAQFLTGIFILAPIGLTVWILEQIFIFVDNLLHPVINLIFGRSVPGVGFGIVIILIYLTGLVASNIAGKQLIELSHTLLTKVPVFRPLYLSIKQILESFSETGRAAFSQVVLVEFPRKGMRALAFVVSETMDKSGNKLLNIYVPGSPNPTSGFLEIVTESEVVRTNIPVNEAMKMLISAGKLIPPGFRESWPVKE